MSPKVLPTSIKTNWLMAKLKQLEKECAELQNCLSEALHKLEAVDTGLQTDKGVT
jgi:hypothetical protein